MTKTHLLCTLMRGADREHQVIMVAVVIQMVIMPALPALLRLIFTS